ncbi:MAG TPA: hypothetical protein VMT03_25095 [Polyangia bacterium]|nr:hypothetical protein [Polyangia bacterium]
MLASLAIDWIFYAVAALGLIWMLVPLLMAAIGWRPVRVDVIEDPLSVEPGSGDPTYRLRFTQLVAAGFGPLGTTIETRWFNTPLCWQRQSLQGERWLASADRKTFVALHRVVLDEPVRFCAVTLLQGGGLVQTVCPGIGLSGDVGTRHRRAEVQNIDVVDLLRRHRRNVEEFCGERNLIPREATLRDLAVEDTTSTRLTPRAQTIRTYWPLLLLIVGVPLLGFAVMLHTPGREDRHLHDLALSALTATAMYAVVRHHLLNVAVRQQALRRHGLG